MKKPPRLTTVEKIQAKQAAPPAPLALPMLTIPQVNNLAFAARRALAGLAGKDLEAVGAAIAQAEAILEHHRRLQAVANPPAAPPAPPTPAAPAAKG